MTKITIDAQAKLPDPPAVLYRDIGFRQDAAAIALWRNHGYDTGVEPFYSADQLHSYACARVAAARLASTSPAPDGWVDELAKRWERAAEQHGVRTFTGNDHLLFANELRAAAKAAAPQPVGEKENG